MKATQLRKNGWYWHLWSKTHKPDAVLYDDGRILSAYAVGWEDVDDVRGEFYGPIKFVKSEWIK